MKLSKKVEANNILQQEEQSLKQFQEAATGVKCDFIFLSLNKRWWVTSPLPRCPDLPANSVRTVSVLTIAGWLGGTREVEISKQISALA